MEVKNDTDICQIFWKKFQRDIKLGTKGFFISYILLALIGSMWNYSLKYCLNTCPFFLAHYSLCFSFFFFVFPVIFEPFFFFLVCLSVNYQTIFFFLISALTIIQMDKEKKPILWLNNFKLQSNPLLYWLAI